MPRKRAIRTVQVQDAKSDTLIELEVTADEEAFVTAYFDNNMNATQAYIELHPKAEYVTARSEGSRITAKPNIRARIDEVLKLKAMGRDEVLARLGDMARATHKPYVRIDSDGFVYFDFSHPEAKANLHLIKKIKTKRQRLWVGRGEESEEWEGEWVEVELHDPQKALELIGKYYKMFTDKREEEKSGEALPVTIPADLLTSDFINTYRDIMQGRHTEYTFDGGRGGLKSTFISEMITVLLANNKDMHALVLRQIKDTLRESVYSQFVWAIDRLGLADKFDPKVSPMEITYIPTGQKIYFRGADKPESIKSIKPRFGYIGIVWFEEFDQFTGENAVRNIKQSALRGGDRAFQFESWNTPRKKIHWVNQYLNTPRESRLHTKANYLNVPRDWLGQIFLDEAEYLKKTNPDAYDHEYGGIANGEGGSVFDNVEFRAITDQEIAQFDNIKMGVDWGSYPHPYVWGKYHYDAGRETIYVLDELIAYKKSARNEETARVLKEEKGVTANDLIIADSAEPKSVGDYVAYGLYCRGAEKGPGSVRYSVKWLQNRVKIVIDRARTPFHAKQYEEYEYLRNKDGELIGELPDEGDDAPDATRYAHNLIWRQRGK